MSQQANREMLKPYKKHTLQTVFNSETIDPVLDSETLDPYLFSVVILLSLSFIGTARIYNSSLTNNLFTLAYVCTY